MPRNRNVFAGAEENRLQSQIAEAESAARTSTLDAEPVPPPPMKEADEDFFEWMDSFSPEVWGNTWLYLYRLYPEIINPGENAYLDPKYARALDRDEIAEKEGGGKYRIVLNWRPTRKAFASHEFLISGAPKFRPGQTLKSTGKLAAPEQSPAAAVQDTISQVVSELAKLIKPDGTQAEAMALLRKGAEQAMDVVTTASKKQIEGAAHPPDQLQQIVSLMTALKAMNPAPAAAPNPLAQLGELANLLKAIQPPQSGIMGELREALGEKIVDRLFDGGSGSPEVDWKSLGIKMLGGVVDQVPAILDKLITLQRGTQQQTRVIDGAPAAPLTPAPTLAAAPAGQPVQAAADVSTTQAPPLENPQDAAMQLLVGCFQKGRDGADAVMVLDSIVPPDVLAIVHEQMSKYPLFAVVAWVKQQPQFAAIADDPRLSEFVGEIRDELEEWAKEQAEASAEATAEAAAVAGA